MLYVFLLTASITAATGNLSQTDCTLTAKDKIANSALSFDDFDQKGTLRSTARALSDRGCEEQAVEAMQDYLINAGPRTDKEQRLIVWHMAQSLAFSGKEQQAAALMAATRDPSGSNHSLDWNSYVRASWAFLVKDRPAFDVSAAKLASSTRSSDKVNSAIIAAMGRCWSKPYSVAYDAGCGKKSASN